MSYGDREFGCYGDGYFGHQHTRQACANILAYYAEENFTSRGKLPPVVRGNCTVVSLIAMLGSEMSEDADEETLATDWLNEHAPFTGAYWGWLDGDFGLWPEESEAS